MKLSFAVSLFVINTVVSAAPTQSDGLARRSEEISSHRNIGDPSRRRDTTVDDDGLVRRKVHYVPPPLPEPEPWISDRRRDEITGGGGLVRRGLPPDRRPIGHPDPQDSPFDDSELVARQPVPGWPEPTVPLSRRELDGDSEIHSPSLEPLIVDRNAPEHLSRRGNKGLKDPPPPNWNSPPWALEDPWLDPPRERRDVDDDDDYLSGGSAGNKGAYPPPERKAERGETHPIGWKPDQGPKGSSNPPRRRVDMEPGWETNVDPLQPPIAERQEPQFGNTGPPDYSPPGGPPVVRSEPHPIGGHEEPPENPPNRRGEPIAHPGDSPPIIGEREDETPPGGPSDPDPPIDNKDKRDGRSKLELPPSWGGW